MLLDSAAASGHAGLHSADRRRTAWSSSGCRRSFRRGVALLAVLACCVAVSLAAALSVEQYQAPAFAAAGAWAPCAGPSRASQLRGSRLARHAQDPDAADTWAGLPASSGPARRVLRSLRESPDVFGATLEQELATLSLKRDDDAAPDSSQGSDADAAILLRRVGEVLSADRRRTASELLHAAVAGKFEQLGVPPVQRLKGVDEVRFGPVDLQKLSTHLHSQDALELVKEHTLGIIGEWSHLSRDFKLQLALYQAGEVYLASALFGYALRRADARYRLEKLMSPETAPATLKDYVTSFGPEEAERAMLVDSCEAEAVVERQVRALFGNLRRLQDDLFDAIGEEAAEAGSDQAMAALKQAVHRGEVASVRINVGDLRRLALEGVAFGRLLGDAEAEVDAMYNLTPGAARHPPVLHGKSEDEEEESRGEAAGRAATFTWPRGFQMFGS